MFMVRVTLARTISRFKILAMTEIGKNRMTLVSIWKLLCRKIRSSCKRLSQQQTSKIDALMKNLIGIQSNIVAIKSGLSMD